MFAQISHERSQALLRQRNLLALTSAGLAIALVIAAGLAATRKREVVLVPTMRLPLKISSAGISAQYLEFCKARYKKGPSTGLKTGQSV